MGSRGQFTPVGGAGGGYAPTETSKGLGAHAGGVRYVQTRGEGKGMHFRRQEKVNGEWVDTGEARVRRNKQGEAWVEARNRGERTWTRDHSASVQEVRYSKKSGHAASVRIHQGKNQPFKIKPTVNPRGRLNPRTGKYEAGYRYPSKVPHSTFRNAEHAKGGQQALFARFKTMSSGDLYNSLDRMNEGTRRARQGGARTGGSPARMARTSNDYEARVKNTRNAIQSELRSRGLSSALNKKSRDASNAKRTGKRK